MLDGPRENSLAQMEGCGGWAGVCTLLSVRLIPEIAAIFGMGAAVGGPAAQRNATLKPPTFEV